MAEETGCWFVDEDGNRVVDLNDRVNFILEQGFRSNDSQVEHEWLERDGVDGGRSAGASEGPSSMTGIIRIPPQVDADTFDDVLTLLHVQLRQKRNRIELRAPGSETSYFIETFRSPIPALYQGETDLKSGPSRLWAKFPLTIYRQPTSFLAPVVGEDQAVGNAAGSRTFLVNNPGKVDSEMLLEATVDGGNVGEIEVGIRPFGNLTEWETLVSKILSGNSTSYVDTAAAAVPDASGAGGTALVCTFNTRDDMARRFRETTDATDSTALEGLHRYDVRMCPFGGTDGTSAFRLMARHSFSGEEMAIITSESIEVDPADISTHHFTDIPLTFLNVPPGVTRVRTEVWAERFDADDDVTADQGLAFDVRHLMPAGHHLALSCSPGLRIGDPAVVTYKAEQLTGTGVRKKDTYRLNDTGEVAQARPSAGEVLPAGIYEARCDVRLLNQSDTKKKLGELQVQYNDGAGWITHRALSLKTKRDRSETGTERGLRLPFQVTQANFDAGRLWRIQVVFTAAPEDRRRIDVRELSRSLIPAMTSAGSILLDSWERTARFSVSEFDSFDLEPLSSPILAPPGNFGVMVRLGDLPVDAGYRHLLQSGPVTRDVKERAATVRADILAPRMTH